MSMSDLPDTFQVDHLEPSTDSPHKAPPAKRLHIALVGPIATSDVAHLLAGDAQRMPAGYYGAPLMATLIQSLLALGHRVTGITLSTDMPRESNRRQAGVDPNFEIIYCPMRARAWPFNGWRPGRIVDLYWFERKALERAFRSSSPQVIHAHWAYEFAWAALRSGIPHVVTSHDSPFTIARYYKGFKLGGYRWLRAFMAWHVFRHAKAVTTVSPYMVDQIQSMCRVPVVVVPNPIAEGVFAMDRQPHSGKRRVLMVSSGWDERKNLAVGLQAFSLAAHQVSNAELILVGRGFGPSEEAAQYWQQHGLQGSVRFIGSTSHDEVLKWMAECDILLHPSLEESFGAVLSEAMALGIPAVGGRFSGAVPWVIGEWGRLVDVRSPESVAGALVELLQNDDLRRKLGEAGRESVRQRFSASRVVAEYLRQYRLAVAGQAADLAVAPQ